MPLALTRMSESASLSPGSACPFLHLGLDVMLMDSALECMARARIRLEQGRSSQMQQLVSDAAQIIGELRSNLDPREGGAFAVNLDDLCEYMHRQLMAANLEKRFAPLDEVSDLLREMRSVWVMLPMEVHADV